MAYRDDSQRDTAELRRRAEELWQQRAERPLSMEPEEVSRLLHELEVHQIELEMQNEELRRAHEELEAAHARYFDLFELAPVGYLTFDEQGVILSANLAVANLLALERSQILHRNVARFVHRDDQDILYLHQKTLLRAEQTSECELRLLTARGGPRWVSMQSVLAEHSGSSYVFRSTLSDISERKQAEEQRATAQRIIEHQREQLLALSRRLVDTQERERGYVADQLLNEATQVLAAARVYMAHPDPSQPPATRIAETQAMLDQVMQHLHHLATYLRPAALDRLGLVSAVAQAAEQWGREHGLEVHVQSPGLEHVRIQEGVETAVYRVIQEAMANVALHARAGIMGISLARVGSELQVVVEDNGVGFDPDAVSDHDAVGLIEMRERMEAVGGTLEIESARGSGTTIIARAPLQLR